MESLNNHPHKLKKSASLLQWLGRIGKYLFLVIVGIFFLLPFYWMTISSFRPKGDFYKLPIPIFPQQTTINNYQLLFERSNFETGLLNSFFLATVCVILQVFFCALAGYTFAKMKFKGKDVLFTIMLSTMMIPASVGLIASFVIMSKIGWIDTYWPLIIPTIANAFGVFWMRQYCYSIPDELLDAGKIDGAGDFKIFYAIVLPIITPALAALGVFVFLATWNDFMAPLIYLRSQELYTVQLWLAIVARYGTVPQPNLVMAGSVLASIPILLIFVFFQRYFVAGLTAGSVK